MQQTTAVHATPTLQQQQQPQHHGQQQQQQLSHCTAAFMKQFRTFCRNAAADAQSLRAADVVTQKSGGGEAGDENSGMQQVFAPMHAECENLSKRLQALEVSLRGGEAERLGTVQSEEVCDAMQAVCRENARALQQCYARVAALMERESDMRPPLKEMREIVRRAEGQTVQQTPEEVVTRTEEEGGEEAHRSAADESTREEDATMQGDREDERSVGANEEQKETTYEEAGSGDEVSVSGQSTEEEGGRDAEQTEEEEDIGETKEKEDDVHEGKQDEVGCVMDDESDDEMPKTPHFERFTIQRSLGPPGEAPRSVVPAPIAMAAPLASVSSPADDAAVLGNVAATPNRSFLLDSPAQADMFRRRQAGSADLPTPPAAVLAAADQIVGGGGEAGAGTNTSIITFTSPTDRGRRSSATPSPSMLQNLSVAPVVAETPGIPPRRQELMMEDDASSPEMKFSPPKHVNMYTYHGHAGGESTIVARITADDYDGGPQFLRRQVSAELLNSAIETLNQHLAGSERTETFTEEEMQKVLHGVAKPVQIKTLLLCLVHFRRLDLGTENSVKVYRIRRMGV